MTDHESSATSDVYTPTRLNREVRRVLESGLGLVLLEGEISNFISARSGHLYFTLKDPSAQVRCAMFRQRAMLLRLRPGEGMQVRVRARVSLYEPRGEFQLIVEHMEDAGAGRLQREYEALKARLQGEGLFDPERKRELPSSPRHLALITSPSGAAIRDVLSVLGRRWPLLQVTLYPSLVQGDGAPAELLRALSLAAASGRHDLILITRGGGSLEDLWAFNDETLARAIAACPIPVVSAVGHESDFALSDFVADLRAPTPSAAAELITPDGPSLLRALTQAQQRIALALRRSLEVRQQRLDLAHRRLHAQQPQRQLQRMGMQLQALSARMERCIDARGRDHQRQLGALLGRLTARHPGRLIERHKDLLQRLNAQMDRRIRWQMSSLRQSLQHQGLALQAVSPLRTLQRGYAVVRSDQDVISDASLLQAGLAVKVTLAKGGFSARVESIDQGADQTLPVLRRP